MFYQERYVNMQDKSSAAAYASDEGTEEIVIPLRPHHGMCLAYFKGEGYSNGFTAHMAEMLKIFLEGKKIRLHVDTDEICSACPNNLGGHCEAGDKVAEKAYRYTENGSEQITAGEETSDSKNHIRQRIIK